MNDQPGRYTRLRYSAAGAVAALAAVGVIAGAGALAAKPPATGHGGKEAHASLTKSVSPAVPAKSPAQAPVANHQPFFDAIQQLVAGGTLTAAQAQAVDGEIQAGRVDTDTLTGLTPAQLDAVEQALGGAKRALAPATSGGGAPTKGAPGQAG